MRPLPPLAFPGAEPGDCLTLARDIAVWPSAWAAYRDAVLRVPGCSQVDAVRLLVALIGNEPEAALPEEPEYPEGVRDIYWAVAPVCQLVLADAGPWTAFALRMAGTAAVGRALVEGRRRVESGHDPRVAL